MNIWHYLAPLRNMLRKPICDSFFDLVIRNANNFEQLSWQGHSISQNIFDLWVIQETLWEMKPELIIETGTNKGGSAFFYGQLFDQLDHGNIITIDIADICEVTHPRVQYLIGSSVDESIVGQVRARAEACSGPVLVILDSDHSEVHVRKELDSYAEFVTKGSYLMVQDTVIDTHPMFRLSRPGPLPALEEFLLENKQFEIDESKTERFLISHHPKGWLKRVGA